MSVAATTKSENIHQCNMSQTCQETDFLPNGYQNVLVVIWAFLHTELHCCYILACPQFLSFKDKDQVGVDFF